MELQVDAGAFGYLTVKGRLGRTRLDLALSGEEWGQLLYT
jgi:hypothetical protein